MENTQGKKPAEWFKMLKEPYRSEAIANIEHNTDCKSLYESLYMSFTWSESPQGDKQWKEISESIKAGETTYLEPEQIGNTDKLKPEPIELRPEDLVSGEVYTIIECTENQKWTFVFDALKKNTFYYKKMYHHESKNYYSNNSANIFDKDKIFHATPEEKDLLLGEETDWKAKFEELQNKYDALVDSNSRLEDYDKELEDVTKEQSKLIETLRNELQQNNKKKVYFYMDSNIGVKCSDLQSALDMAKNYTPIYEAVCIGKKKSVLVDEN